MFQAFVDFNFDCYGLQLKKIEKTRSQSVEAVWRGTESKRPVTDGLGVMSSAGVGPPSMQPFTRRL